MVALLSSSGVKLASVNLVSRELFPTLLLPMSSNLRLGGASGRVEVMRERFKVSGGGGKTTGYPVGLIRYSQIGRLVCSGSQTSHAVIS